MIGGINLPAVLASAVAGVAVNFVWFTVLFREPYIAGLGRTEAQMDAGPSVMTASVIQFAGFVVLAYGLAWLMRTTQMVSPGGGVTLAAICWLAFVAAIIGPMYAYQAFPLSLYAIVTGGYLLVMVVSGAVLGVWRGPVVAT